MWREGALLVSEDAGETFRLTDTDESPHIHGDVHAVYFDPTDFAGERVFIAHDGGISMFPELGRDASKVESFYNRQLATLQFQTAPSRMFYGGGGANQYGWCWSSLCVLDSTCPWRLETPLLAELPPTAGGDLMSGV